MAISAAGFSFSENGISDEVMQTEAKMSADGSDDNWEVVRDEKNSKVMRRLHADSGLYEFRCSGSYCDITASDFVEAQMDLHFRQQWDANVEKAELISRDENSDSELIHWIVKFPYPMYPREYVFVRRRYINANDRCIVIANCGVSNSAAVVPLDAKKYVRVEKYRSVMVVRAHDTFDSKGFDYILSYYDNPESHIPKYAYNWLINSGGPYYLQQVHEAAKKLERLRIEKSVDKEQVEEAKKPSTVEIQGETSDDEMEEFGALDLDDDDDDDFVATDTADIESDIASDTSLPSPSDDISLYAHEPKTAPLREYFIFVD